MAAMNDGKGLQKPLGFGQIDTQVLSSGLGVRLLSSLGRIRRGIMEPSMRREMHRSIVFVLQCNT
jgi:hypothetical protein